MAGFNPNRLHEVRIMRGMTLEQLSDSLGITKQAVSKYEHGKSIPSSDVVEKMIDVLAVTRKYLVKETIVLGSDCSALFFRAMSATTKGNIDLADIVSRWSYEILCGLEWFYKTKTNFPIINENQSIYKKAMEARAHWGVGILPIKNMVALLEKNGFFVFTIDSAELNTDAYSRVINGVPVIVLNKNKGTAVRWRFNLAHELGHLILHRELSKMEFDSRAKELEREANLFAEYFLMPSDGFGSSLIAPKLEHFIPLKKEWGVSVAAMVYHSSNIGLIDAQRAKSLQMQMSKLGWSKDEPLDDTIMFEFPEKLPHLISGQITDTDSYDEFFDTVRLPADEVEHLCSLPKNYFLSYSGKVLENGSNYSSQSKHTQIPLFSQGGVSFAQRDIHRNN